MSFHCLPHVPLRPPPPQPPPHPSLPFTHSSWASRLHHFLLSLRQQLGLLSAHAHLRFAFSFVLFFRLFFIRACGLFPSLILPPFLVCRPLLVLLVSLACQFSSPAASSFIIAFCLSGLFRLSLPCSFFFFLLLFFLRLFIVSGSISCFSLSLCFSCPPLPLPFLWILLFAFCFWAACFWLFLVGFCGWRLPWCFLLGVFLGEFFACLRPLSTFVDASFGVAVRPLLHSFLLLLFVRLFIGSCCLSFFASCWSFLPVVFLALCAAHVLAFCFLFAFHLRSFSFFIVCRHYVLAFLWSWSLCAAHVLSPLLFLGVVFHCVPALFSFGVFCCVPVFYCWFLGLCFESLV